MSSTALAERRTSRTITVPVEAASAGEAIAPLRTPRLLLRPVQEQHADFLVELLNDPDFRRMVGDRGVRCRADALVFLEKSIRPSYRQHGFGPLLMQWHPPQGISPRQAGAGMPEAGEAGPPFVGLCGLYLRDYLTAPDVGYALLPAWRRRGLAREAAGALLRHGREGLGLETVVGLVDARNQASIGVLTACGLQRALRLRSPVTELVSDLYVPAPDAARARSLLGPGVEVIES